MKGLNLFPSERMHREFPWQIWAVGWLAIFKGILWLAYEPVLPEQILRLLGYKYTLGMLPLLVCAVGLWNGKRWAGWGLAAIALADLVFFVIQRATLQAYVVTSEFPGLSPVLSLIVLLCNGPLGDILILAAFPSMRKFSRSQPQPA